MFLKNYNWNNLKKDIPAGIIVALVSIPISIGYSLVAGLPPVYGLYGSWLPILVFGLISSSPRFVFGVDAAPAALVGGLLYALEINYQSEDALLVVPLVAFTCGLWLAIFRLVHMSRFVKFISSPVMGGFITGIGCTIILMQIPKLFGGDAGRGELHELALHLAEEVRECVNLLSLALGLGTIAIILVCRKLAPKIPMTVVMMAVGALLTLIFHVDRYGVMLLPPVEPGLPHVSLRFLTDGVEAASGNLRQIVLTSLTISLVILAETLLATRNIGFRHGDRIDNDREVIAYSAGNLVAAIFGCCPVNGSVSRTGIADQFGVRSQMMSVSASFTMMLILLFGTGFIRYLPVPVLTAIVISALIGILEFDLARHLRHADRTEWWIFYAVMFTVLIFGTIYGVLVGMVLSFVTVIIRMSDPPKMEVGYHPARDGFYPLDRMRDAKPIEGVVIYQFGGALFFGNIEQLHDALAGAVREDTGILILEARNISSVDVTAAARLRIIAEDFSRQGIAFFMTEHSATVNDQLREFGAEDLITGGIVRQHIENALTSSGIRKPYSLVEGEAPETAGNMNENEIENKNGIEIENEMALAAASMPAASAERTQASSSQIAEFEWAYGADADAKMEEFAELLARRMIEEENATEEMIIEAEQEEFGSEFSDADEDHFLELLEKHIDRIGHYRNMSPERLQRIESRIIDRHKRLHARIEERRR